MILFPAIDLKDGQCVRLLRGDMNRATVFNDDPGAQAAAFAAAGARWLHIVDLNGAFAGAPINRAAVESILAAAVAGDARVQLGGGIRDLATVEMWLDAGVARVILGTAAVKDPDMVRQACRLFPGRVAVGVDARGGLVAVEGWAEAATLTAVELGHRFEDAGVAAIVYTDIDRDGAMEGVNVAATAELARTLTTPVIASGGVSSMADLERLKPHEADGIVGVIAGRAIYDGRLDLTAALEYLQS